MSKLVVADTSCLIVLDRIGHLGILQKLFTEIIVTNAIALEFMGGLPNFVMIQDPVEPGLHLSLAHSLDKGEASAIALASEIKADLLIMDERKGRKVATELGLHVIGTLRVLLEAKRKGHIDSLKKAIEDLQKNQFRVSKSIVHELLKLSDEL